MATPETATAKPTLQTGHKSALTIAELKHEVQVGNVFLKEVKSKGADGKKAGVHYYWARNVHPATALGVRFTIGNPTWPEDVQPFLLAKPSPYERNGVVENPDQCGALIGITNADEAADLLEVHNFMKAEVSRVIGKGTSKTAPGTQYRGIISMRDEDEETSGDRPRVLAVSTKLYLRHRTNDSMRTMFNLIGVEHVTGADGVSKPVVKYDPDRTYDFKDLKTGMRVTSTVDIGEVGFYQGRWCNSLYTRFLFRTAAAAPDPRDTPFAFGDVAIEKSCAAEPAVVSDVGGYSSEEDSAVRGASDVRGADALARERMGGVKRTHDDAHDGSESRKSPRNDDA